MNDARIAVRDTTDSHNVAFFDNKAGIKYNSAKLKRFLAGSASILTIKYNSKDIDTIGSGCKLAFRYKNRDYWLNVMDFKKKGFEVELTAYSLGLELNNETREAYKPADAMSIAEYVAYCDPERALTIGVNEVSDKRIKLEWTGTDTILARLFSIANSFEAELDFNVELNDDYSLKRQVLNIYKKGNLGTNKVSQPVRVGKELKVINYSDNIKELKTAVRATGKDGLTIDGLNKKIYDSNKQLLYYSSGDTVYAPQSRDRYPSVSKKSNDSYIAEELGETQYETKEALWGYLYAEIQKVSVPEITYEVEGAIGAGIGDTQILIDDVHFEPALYVKARVSELEEDILVGKVTKSMFINFERKYSQIADNLLKQVEALAKDAAAAAAAAQGTANTAKSTADTAKTNAAVAQNTADTAKTNAATANSAASAAQTSADAAKANAATAKANAAIAQSAAGAAQATLATWCYNNDLTYIDGGNIYAGSVTAAKIAAGAITADKFYGTAITSTNYAPESAGTKIDLANGTIDAKNFKVDASGNTTIKNGGITVKNNDGTEVFATDTNGDLEITGALRMSGSQSVRVDNAAGTLVGQLFFEPISGVTWSPGALKVRGYDYLTLEAGTDHSIPKAYGRIMSRGFGLAMFGSEDYGSSGDKSFFCFGRMGELLGVEAESTSTGYTEKMTFGGEQFPQIIFGSMVYTVKNDSSIAMFDNRALGPKLGAFGVNNLNTVVVVGNGDGAACGAHCQDCTYLNGTWYATFDRIFTGNVRVNYAVITYA